MQRDREITNVIQTYVKEIIENISSKLANLIQESIKVIIQSTRNDSSRSFVE